MFKKLFITLLAISLIGVMAGNVFADGLPRVSDIKTFTYIKAKTADTAVVTAQAVPTTTISTDDRILGWSVCGTSATTGAVAALYDQTATALLAANIIQEAEVTIYSGSKQMMWPYPKKITNQLHILIGASGAVVTIFYEDVSARY